jgi:hypothetical protein
LLANFNSGELLALVGLLLLLVHKVVRRQLVKAGKTVRGLALFWLRWGDVVVFLIIVAGLTLMWSHKR